MEPVAPFHRLCIFYEMYAVIFRAALANPDDDYQAMAARLRARAIDVYGCVDFTCVTEGDQEIAISYWETEQQILAWRNDPEHKLAQAAGREKWYRSFSVDVCEITRSY